MENRKPLKRKTPLRNARPLPKAATGKAKAKPKKKSQTYWKRKCDVLFSLQTRAVGRCERCGKTEGLQCSHVISRTVSALRCDPDNAVAMCAGCHLWWHKEPFLAVQWFEGKFPGRFDRLNAIRNESLGKKTDWEEVHAALQKV